MYKLYLIITGTIGILYIIYKIITQLISVKFLEDFYINLSSAYDSLSPEDKEFDIQSTIFLNTNLYKFDKTMENFNDWQNLEFFMDNFHCLQKEPSGTNANVKIIRVKNSYKSLLKAISYKTCFFKDEIKKNIGKLIIPVFWCTSFVSFIFDVTGLELNIKIPKFLISMLKFVVGFLIPILGFIFEYGDRFNF